MMKNKYIFKLLTGQEIERFPRVEHHVVCYVDDVQHVVGHKRNHVLELYINKLHQLNIGLHSHNFLQINSSKTEFIHIWKTSEKNEKICINDQLEVIKSKNLMKILGYHTNNKITLETHLSRSLDWSSINSDPPLTL